MTFYVIIFGKTSLVRYLVHFCPIRIGKYWTFGLILKWSTIKCNKVQSSTTERHQLRTAAPKSWSKNKTHIVLFALSSRVIWKLVWYSLCGYSDVSGIWGSVFYMFTVFQTLKNIFFQNILTGCDFCFYTERNPGCRISYEKQSDSASISYPRASTDMLKSRT